MSVKVSPSFSYHPLSLTASTDRRRTASEWGRKKKRSKIRNSESPCSPVEYTDCISSEGQDAYDECPGYDTKQSDGEAPVMLELRGMCSNLSLPLLPGSLWPGVVAPDRVLSMSQIEEPEFRQMTDVLKTI